MKIEQVKFRDAVMVAGNNEFVFPNGRTPATEVDVDLDVDVFVIRHKGQTIYAPRDNAAYWIELPAKPKAKTPESKL